MLLRSIAIFLLCVASSQGWAIEFALGRVFRLKDPVAARIFSLEKLGKSAKGYELDRRAIGPFKDDQFYQAANLAPSHPKKEFTALKPNDTRYYYCFDRAALEAALDVDANVLPRMVVPTNHFKFLTPEAISATKTLYLQTGERMHWAKANPTPKPGLYFRSSHPFDGRGPYESVYRDSVRTGHRLVDKKVTELPFGSEVFVAEDLEPCVPSTEFTVRLAQKSGYYCVEKEHFRAFLQEGSERTWRDIIRGDDLAYAPPASQKAAKAAMAKLMPKSRKEFDGRAKEPIIELNPYENIPNPAELSKPFRIEIYAYSDEKTKDAYLASYSGTLYGLCGEHCKLQGYSVVLDSSGEVREFLWSNLAQTAAEYDISKEGLERMRKLANNERDELKTLFEKNTFDDKYTASMSKATELWGAGNSVGTFQLHMSVVRQWLRDKARKGYNDVWPIFDWKKVGWVLPP